VSRWLWPFNMLLAELEKWSSTAAAVQLLHARFDEEVAKAIQKLPPQQRRGAATAVRHPAIRERLLNYAESNFSRFAGIMIDMVLSQGLVAKAAEDGQVRGLAKLLNAGAAPDSFRPAAWHLISCDTNRSACATRSSRTPPVARSGSSCSSSAPGSPSRCGGSRWQSPRPVGIASSLPSHLRPGPARRASAPRPEPIASSPPIAPSVPGRAQARPRPPDPARAARRGCCGSSSRLQTRPLIWRPEPRPPHDRAPAASSPTHR
jgi:hypothetical protein